MVKNMNDGQSRDEPQNIEDISSIDGNQISGTPSAFNLQQSSSNEIVTKKKRKGISKLKDSVEIFEKSATGCVIEYLRNHGPSPIENIVEHVRSKEPSLITSQNGKYKKNAFQMVDYALTWYPKIFRLNDRFHYYLNEEEAKKKERKFQLRSIENGKKRRLNYKKQSEQIREKEGKMQKIKEKIEADLNSERTDVSIMTKAFLVLTSENEKEAEELKLTIRNAYLKFKNLI